MAWKITLTENWQLRQAKENYRSLLRNRKKLAEPFMSLHIFFTEEHYHEMSILA